VSVLPNKIFYGWWVLLGLFLAYGASNGILINTLPLLYPDLIQEFGWNEKEVTRPAAIFFVVSGFAVLFVGFLSDRFSPGRLLLVGLISLVICLAAYAAITSYWQMMTVYVAFAIALALGGVLPSMVILTRWFQGSRGLAVGIFLMSSSLGGAVLPLVIRTTLVEDGWREVLILLAIIGFVFMVLPIIALVKDHPRDKGTSQDGGQFEGGDDTAQTEGHGSVDVLSIHDAVRMPIFYLVALATGAMWFCIVGVVTHQSIYLAQDLGMDTSNLAFVFSAFFFSAFIGKLLFGWLSDYFDKIRIMLVATINLGIGLVILRGVDSGALWTVYAYALIYGIGFSGTYTTIQLVIAELFAGPAYGRILGVFSLIDTLCGATGIEVLGAIRVARGSYLPAIDLMIALIVIAAIGVATISRLQRSILWTPSSE